MKYYVEYTYTVEVEAEDACDAWEKADEQIKDMKLTEAYVYIDGNLVS